MTSIRNVCVFGVGGVGGYFGARIAETLKSAGPDNMSVTFIARGDHLQAIQTDGLQLQTPAGTLTVRPTLAADDFNRAPQPDLILLCVKSYDLPQALRVIRPRVKPDTVVLPLLNGADVYDRIRSEMGTGVVFPACVFVGTHIARPGVIHQDGGDGRILFGADPQQKAFSPQAVTDFFDMTAIDFEWATDPFPAIWRKFLFIAAFGLVTAATGHTLGQVMADEQSRRQVRSIMTEVQTIAHKKGVRLETDIIATSLAKAHQFPPDTQTSLQRDVARKGALNEGDLFGGTILRLGQALGVDTPVTRETYQRIRERFQDQWEGA